MSRLTSLSFLVRGPTLAFEPLEPRVLLSADPIFTPLMVALMPDRNDIQSLTEAYAAAQEATSISVPLMARLLSSPAANSAASTFAVDAVLFDAGQMILHEGFMDTSLRVAANEVLGGSGSLDIALLNTGVVSPGYSPGVLNVASYTQSSDGTLEIQIGGGTAGTGVGHYDQLNVSGAAILDGKLSISLLNGYKPADGETFSIINYGSVSGKFDVGSGLLQSDDGLYFALFQVFVELRVVKMSKLQSFIERLLGLRLIFAAISLTTALLPLNEPNGNLQ